MTYPAIFALGEVGTIRGFEHRACSVFLPTLSDEVRHTLAEAAGAVMSPQTLVQLRVLGGAMKRVAAEATAFAHRDKQAMVMVTHYAPPAEAGDLQARTEYVWQALSPYADGMDVNFLMEGQQWVREAYPLV